MKTIYTDRRNQNDLRTAVEATLRQAGLVENAGGTRFTYFGYPGQGKTGYQVRVGIKAFRLVHRVRGSDGLHDITVGVEKYHGKVDHAKLLTWGRHLAEGSLLAMERAYEQRPAPIDAIEGVPS